MLFWLDFMIVSVTLASLSYFNISKLCVCFLFQFLFIFYFEFWVLCGSQCHSWNDCIWASYYLVWASTSSLWSSWNLWCPRSSIALYLSFLCFSISPDESCVQPTIMQDFIILSLSPPLFGYTGMICSSSINYSEFEHGFLSNDIIYGLGYEIGRWRQRSRW